MKTIVKVLSILTLSLLVTNCKDVVDADENIHKIPLKYSRILGDQTHSVIMPLKTGNTWIYQVTVQAPLSIHYDTVVVYDPVTINGEKWFKVKYPMISETEIIKMTNTDLGLWVKCDSCAYNYAPYPVISSEVLCFVDTFPSRYKDGSKISIELSYYVDITKSYPLKYNNQNNSTLGILYDFTPGLRTILGNTKEKIILDFDEEKVFVPDSGLFKKTVYSFIDSVTRKVERAYDLIDCKISR